MKAYSSTEIQRILGILGATVYYYVQACGVEPYVESKGRGGRRKFNSQNLIEFAICKTLQEFSIESHTIKRIIDWLNDPRACVIQPIGYKADPRTLSEIPDEEFFEALKQPSGPTPDRCSFWDMLRRRPATDETFVSVYFDDFYGDFVFNIEGPRQTQHHFDNNSPNFRAILVLNIAELIQKYGFE